MKVYKKNKLIYGVAVNDLQRNVYDIVNGKTVRCPIYHLWREMLKRCFCPVYHARQPTYINCTIDPEWLMLSNFEKWVIAQDWQGKHLDKDILVVGNKFYGPDTCIFVSKQLNNFLTDHGAKRGNYPIGVSWHKATKKYQAQCSNPFTGERGYLGYFDNVDDAHLAWKARKHQHALVYADMQEDERVAEALRIRYL